MASWQCREPTQREPPSQRRCRPAPLRLSAARAQKSLFQLTRLATALPQSEAASQPSPLVPPLRQQITLFHGGAKVTPTVGQVGAGLTHPPGVGHGHTVATARLEAARSMRVCIQIYWMNVYEELFIFGCRAVFSITFSFFLSISPSSITTEQIDQDSAVVSPCELHGHSFFRVWRCSEKMDFFE